jgi:hypothetical protein
MNFLDVNTNYVVKSERDTLDNIDARCIDVPSIFIDITAVCRYEDKRQNRHTKALICRDNHHFGVYYLLLYIYILDGG